MRGRREEGLGRGGGAWPPARGRQEIPGVSRPARAQVWGALSRAQSSECRATEREPTLREIGDTPRHVLISVSIPPDDA